MRSPLLGDVKNEHLCAGQKFLRLFGFNQHTLKQKENAAIEEPVGAIRTPAQLRAAARSHQRPLWKPHVDEYFTLASFVLFQHGTAYTGAEDPEVEFAMCMTTNATLCAEYCTQQMLAVTDEEILALPRYCQKDSQRCWDTHEVRCWNEFGGNIVSDGQKEWTLTRHFQGDETMDIKWMHLFVPGWDMLIFGPGRMKSIEQICEEIKRSDDLNNIAATMFPTQSIIIAGHSEGSGWAVCFNKMLASEKDFFNERLLIASGAMVPRTRAFYLSLDAYSRSHSLFLMAENRSPEGLIPGGYLPDIQPLLSVDQGATFPSFTLSCDISSTICNSISKEANLRAALQRAEAFLQESPNSVARESIRNALHRQHLFENYQKCYDTCRLLFDQGRDFNFKTNTPIFVKNIPEDERVPSLPGGCRFC